MAETKGEFWRLVWDQRVKVVVMITNLVEQGKRKCEQYWPDVGTQLYGVIDVTLLDESVQVRWKTLPFDNPPFAFREQLKMLMIRIMSVVMISIQLRPIISLTSLS